MRRALWALPSAAALLVFWPAARFGFVNFDDQAVLLRNPVISGAWTWREAFTRAHATTYAPLCWLSLRAVCSVLGFKAALLHSLLLLAHAACAAAVFLLARALYSGPRRELAACFAALLFALHPVQAEAVGEAACVAVVPAALLALASILLFLRGRRRAAWLLFALSGLWHWEAVALPAVLLCLGAAWIDAAPFALIAACVAALNAAAKRAAVGYSSFAARPGAAARGALHALGSLLWPDERLPVYVYSSGPRLWESGLLFLAVCGLVFLARKRRPALAAAWIGFLALLAPPLLLTGKEPTWGHDHYLYLACVPLCLLAGGALARTRSRAVLAAAAMLLALCGLEARRDVMLWRDSETLWRHAFARDPSSPIFAYRLGETLMQDRGRVDEAIAYFRIQKRLDPDQAEARKVLGYAYNRRGFELMEKGRRREAAASF